METLKPFTVMSKFLEGEKYPMAGGVIPALEQIKEDLENIEKVEKDQVSKQFLQSLNRNMEIRFKDNFKKKRPFNCLTFLDPRHVNMYCLEDDVFNKVKDDIKFDTVFDDDIWNEPLPQSAQSKPPSEHLGQDKQSQLLKRKLESTNSQQMNTFESRVDKEINRYIDFKIEENHSFSNPGSKSCHPSVS